MSADDSHHPWQELLDGDVTPAAMAHVVACPHCAEMIRGVDRAVDAVRASLPQPTTELDERVLGALASERPPRRALPGRRAATALARLLAAIGMLRSPARLAALAAGVALVLVVALWPAGHAERALAVPIAPLSSDCDGRDGGPGGDRLLVAGVWSGEEARRFAAVLHRFEQRTGIRVSYAYETRDIAAKLEARLRRACPPEVALLPQPGLLRSLAKRRLIQPLDAPTSRQVRRSYGPSWRRLASARGRLYGVWFKAANKSTVWFRPAALRAAGVTRAPADWSELEDATRRLRAAGMQPLAVGGADGWTITDWFENVYLRTAGPRRYDQLARHEIPWTHPTVRRALRIVARMLRDPAVAGSPVETLRTTFEQSVAGVFGPGARAAMVFEGGFVRSFIPSGATGDFFPFPGVAPSSRGDVVVGGDVAVTFSASTEAQRLMRFLATASAAEPWAQAGGFVSPNRSLPSSAYPDALSRRVAAALARARTVRFDLSDLQPPAFGATDGQGMWAIMRDLLREPNGADRAAARLEAAARAAFACERTVRGKC